MIRIIPVFRGYSVEKWNPSELNDKGVIVQLLKSWICVPSIIVPKNQRLGGCASPKVHNRGVHTSWEDELVLFIPVNNTSSSSQPFKAAACLQARCFPSSLVQASQISECALLLFIHHINLREQNLLVSPRCYCCRCYCPLFTLSSWRVPAPAGFWSC